MTATPPRTPAAPGAPAAAPRRWVDVDGTHLDVRGMEPPAPLVAILTLVEASDPATVVIVHHDRDPVLLYPELAEIGWAAQRIDAPPGEVRLRLARES